MPGCAPLTSVRRSLFIEQMADPAVLREAWYRVQRGGRAGGVDGVTVPAFRPHADRRLGELCASLMADTYRPSPVGAGSTPSLLMHIQRGTLAFRQALVDHLPYRAYRMTW